MVKNSHLEQEFDTYSRLALEKTIDYLDQREKYTTYHPDTNTFIIRPKLMARIIKHGGNLQAKINKDDYDLFLRVLNNLNRMNKIESIYRGSGYTYNMNEYNGSRHYGIIVKKIHKIDGRGGLCLLKT